MGLRRQRARLPDVSIELMDVRTAPRNPGVDSTWLVTNMGDIECAYHAADAGEAAVLWVGGAGGGLDGPAGGLYPRLAARLVPDRIASLRLHYRHPAELTDCVMDTLVGVAWLRSLNRERIVLVGHSFGGAVVISAGALSEAVVGVVAMSSQTAGADLIARLGSRRLLLLHGSDDEILPDTCSRQLYARAGKPKEMILYPGCRHGLDECRDQVDSDLMRWLRELLVQEASLPRSVRRLRPH